MTIIRKKAAHVVMREREKDQERAANVAWVQFQKEMQKASRLLWAVRVSHCAR